MNSADGTRYVMGTFLKAHLEGSDPSLVSSALSIVFDEVQRLDQLLSIYNADSDITRVNKAAGDQAVRVHPKTFLAVDRALHWAELSGGAFDPTVRPLTHAWGFDGFEGHFPAEEERRRAHGKVGYRHVVLNGEAQTIFLPVEGMGLDLGGIGKGFALDRALEKVDKAFSLESVFIDFGGQLLFWNRRGSFSPEKVIINNPQCETGIASSFTVDANCSVSTSSNAERFFEFRDRETGSVASFGHLLDPRIGKSARGPDSVTIVAPTGTEAEALSTAAFVMSAEERTAWLEKFPTVQSFISQRVYA